VTFMLRHGLSVGTAGEIVRQVVSERTSNTRWKRPVILDRVQWDLFRSHWKRAKPDLSTFFINSTAHYQHIYWRHMDPESFDVKPDPAERAIYEDAIPYGYRQMDRVCGRFMDLADDQTTLVFLTALSQEPCLKYEDIGGKMMYRPEDFDRFLAAIGVHAPVRAAPVMGEEFHLDFAAEDDARDTESKLSALRYHGAPAMRVERRGANVFSGCAVSEQVPPDAVLELGGTEIPFFDVFYQLDLVKSGIHHPDGMLWIRTPARHHAVNDERVPLVSVAPTVLGMLGLDVPGHMRGAPVGASMQPA
jgi:hypothetical protein